MIITDKGLFQIQTISFTAIKSELSNSYLEEMCDDFIVNYKKINKQWHEIKTIQSPRDIRTKDDLTNKFISILFLPSLYI